MSKKQFAVFAALNAVIVALVLVAVFVMPNFGTAAKPEDIPAAAPEQTHEKFREPMAGKNGVERETRLMGLGDETVVKCFSLADRLYIFGNATVKGLDFDSYGGFMCEINARGKICAFTYFDGILTAAGMIEGGFAVGTAVGTSDYRIYFADGNGASEVCRASGKPVSLFATDTGLAAVTVIGGNAIMLTEYSIKNGAFSQGKSTYISSGYELTFFDCFCLGDRYIIAARASSLPRYDSLVFYTFSAGGDAAAHYYGGSGENALRPFAVMPDGNGFLAAAMSGGEAALIRVDYSFMSFRKDILGFKPEGGRMFYADGVYYAAFFGEEKRTYTAEEQSFSRLTALDGIELIGVSSDGGIKYYCAEAGLTVVSDGKRTVLDISDPAVYSVDKYGILLSATGGNALSEPSAGRDIYLIKLASDTV